MATQIIAKAATSRKKSVEMESSTADAACSNAYTHFGGG